MLFGFIIVINNFSVIPRRCLFFSVIPRHGVWLRQGFQCFVGDLSGFNTVLDVIVLSQYGIKSQPHNIDTRANSPSPTLKNLNAKWGATNTIFKNLVCLCPGANPLPPDLGSDTFLHTRTKCADQQCSNLTVDQCLCFRYIDGTSLCTSFIRKSKFLAILCSCTFQFVFDLVINPRQSQGLSRRSSFVIDILTTVKGDPAVAF